MFLLLFCRPAESGAHNRPARSRQAPQSLSLIHIWALKKAVEKENEAHPEETAYYLPETLNGETVTWSKVPDLTGLELMALAAAAGAVCWAAKGREQEKARQKREEQMLRDYPEIVSKMVLLLGAGLGMRKVLERIAVDYRKNLALGGQKRFAYEEIVFTCQEMENGVSEQEAVSYTHLYPRGT